MRGVYVVENNGRQFGERSDKDTRKDFETEQDLTKVETLENARQNFTVFSKTGVLSAKTTALYTESIDKKERQVPRRSCSHNN